MDAFVLLSILTVSMLMVGRERRLVGGGAARSLRALLPAWRFFDRVEDAPVLTYRIVQTAGEPGPFRPLPLPVRTRSAGALLLAPSGNLRLAIVSLLEQLLSDVAELESDDEGAVEQLVSYRLTEQLVRGRLAPHERTPGTRFQFKLSTRDAEGAAEDVLISKLVAA